MSSDSHKIALLSSAYLAPIQYFVKLTNYGNAWIEQEENYLKQSYRNRCIILAANGPLVLSIPVTNGPSAKAPMKELRLSYDHHWQRMHWRSIVSAYNNSPFFEYYADDLYPFYHAQRWKFLIDYNTELQQVILDLLRLKPSISFTHQYFIENNTPDHIVDFRYSIHPKTIKNQPDPCFTAQPYNQVFQEKFGFVPNLSIIDLLFNEGPSAGEILGNCMSK
jgi:hypothetical protein